MPANPVPGPFIQDRTQTPDEGVGEPLTRPLRLLVVSDQELWIRSLDSTLGRYGFSVTGAPSGKEAIEQIGLVRPDLLMIHTHLRDISGMELCSRLRTGELIDAAVPVIMITPGPCKRELRIQALRAGAWDYLSFPPDPEILALKLGVYARAKLNLDRVREESHVDEVTDLYTTVGIMRRANELAVHARRHRRALACMVLALVRDSQGGSNEGGEERTQAMVRSVARLLKSAARTSDVIGRLGVAEFVVFAPDTDEVGILELSRRLIEKVESAGPSSLGLAPGGLQMMAGFDAIPDLGASALEPVDMVVRATLALSETTRVRKRPASG